MKQVFVILIILVQFKNEQTDIGKRISEPRQ